MILAKTWKGDDLSGEWECTLKIDGVRALYRDGVWLSRANKPLYNIPTPNPGIVDVEIFCGSFKKTIEAVKTKHGGMVIQADAIYSLDPLDERLRFRTFNSPTADHIMRHLSYARTEGYEGLMLRQGDAWLKVKPKATYDVPVTGVIEGKGRNKGRMGAVMTPMGKVGIGFSDDERVTFWSYAQDVYENDYIQSPIVGMIIEVECMELTPDGKFRHGRFIRTRPDK